MTAVAEQTATLIVRTQPIALQAMRLGTMLVAPGAGTREALKLRSKGALQAFREGVLGQAVRPADGGEDRHALRSGVRLTTEEIALLSEDELRELLAQWLSADGSMPFGRGDALPCTPAEAELRWERLLEQMVRLEAEGRQRVREAQQEACFGLAGLRKRLAEERREQMASLLGIDRQYREELERLFRPDYAALARATTPSPQDLVRDLLEQQLAPWRCERTIAEEQAAFLEGCVGDLTPALPEPDEEDSITVAVPFDPIVFPRVEPLSEQLAPVVREVGADVRASANGVAVAVQRIEAQQEAFAREVRSEVATVRAEAKQDARFNRRLMIFGSLVALLALAIEADEKYGFSGATTSRTASEQAVPASELDAPSAAPQPRLTDPLPEQ